MVAGFVVALLGGSRTQVTGPTAAFIVILAPIYEKFGFSGLLVAGLFGGLILIALGLFRLGSLIQFVPHPVTTGFTAGIATVIATLQMKDLLGLTVSGSAEHFAEKVALLIEALPTIDFTEVGVGGVTLLLLIFIPHITRRVPAPLVALPLVTIATALGAAYVPEFSVETIASRFQTNVGGAIVHGIPQLPPTPLLPWHAPGPHGAPLAFDFQTLRSLFVAGWAVAILGAIESLLSAVVADGMARTKHDPDAELIAQGVGNVVGPFFGGIAATGAIARTATNIKSGARSPVAAMVHAVTILGAVLLLAPLLGYLPMAALAALLLIVAWNMSEARHFVHTVRVAPKSDVAVLLTCYFLTVGFDMIVGVSVGMLLAALLFMKRMAEVTQTRAAHLDEGLTDLVVPPGVGIYEISGPLFFGAAQKAMAALEIVATDTRVVILLMSRVSVMDATGLVALESAVNTLKNKKVTTILAALEPQPRQVIERAHLLDHASVSASPSLHEAIERAQQAVSAMSSRPPDVRSS
jgi:SulP family sulfate permease